MPEDKAWRGARVEEDWLWGLRSLHHIIQSWESLLSASEPRGYEQFQCAVSIPLVNGQFHSQVFYSVLLV